MNTSRRATDLALIAGFAALVAVCAILPSLSIGGPVPVTLQTFGVLLSGAVLGTRRGFLAVLLYVAAGAAGLPIFAGGASGLSASSGSVDRLPRRLPAGRRTLRVHRRAAPPQDRPDQRADHLPSPAS